MAVTRTPVRQLELVTEAKVFDILEGVLSPRLEASGVLAKDGMFYVIFDNLPHIARIDPAISAAAEGNSIIWQDQGHRSGFEDITHDPWNGRFYVLIESLPRGRRRYMAKVQEYDADFGYTGSAWLNFPLDRPNKGIEGLACVRRQGQTYLLGLCEGNRCRGGAEGRVPGGGRVHVFRAGQHQWERLGHHPAAGDGPVRGLQRHRAQRRPDGGDIAGHLGAVDRPAGPVGLGGHRPGHDVRAAA